MRVLSAPRATLAALSCLILLAGCSGTAGRSEGSGPSGRASATSAAGASPTAAPHKNVRLGEVDLKNFSYVGGCGFEVPAPTIKLDDGKQAAATPSFAKVSSVARLTGSEELALNGEDYLLAHLSCKIDGQKFRADHLIGAVDGRPTDLGIVATGSKIRVDTDDRQLSFDTTYRTIDDGPGAASGRSSYTIEIVGRTPIRVFSGERLDAVRDGLRSLPAHGYDAGLVGINAFVDDSSDATWLIGLLDKKNQVLTADTIGGGYQGECLDLTVHTRDGEKIAGGLRAYPDDDVATGTVVDLKSASTSPTGALGTVTVPVKTEQSGLLIPANGVVPALATVTTRTSGDALKSPLVITRAPADAWIDVWRFGAASGSEYPLPVGAFATAAGRIAMTGAWYKAPIKESAAAVGMSPILAPDAAGEQTCS